MYLLSVMSEELNKVVYKRRFSWWGGGCVWSCDFHATLLQHNNNKQQKGHAFSLSCSFTHTHRYERIYWLPLSHTLSTRAF